MPIPNNPRDASAAMDLIGLRLGEGVPQATIARELLENGYSSRSGKPWTTFMVSNYAKRGFRHRSRPTGPFGATRDRIAADLAGSRRLGMGLAAYRETRDAETAPPPEQIPNDLADDVDELFGDDLRSIQTEGGDRG